MFYRRRMSEYQQELSLLNQFPENKLYEEFFKCCGSPGWVREMLKLRPFGTAEQLFDKANQVWWNLPKEEWMNAFAAHPKIGLHSISIPFTSELRLVCRRQKCVQGQIFETRLGKQ